MKRITLLITLLALYQISYEQCDQKLLLKCSTVRRLKDGVADKEMKMEATITSGNGTIFLTVIDNGKTQTKKLEIKEVICEWKDYMKNGRVQYKVVGKESDGNSHNSIVEMVSNNGYTNLTFASYPDDGSKLQFDVAEYIITADTTTGTPPIKPNKKSKKKQPSKMPSN